MTWSIPRTKSGNPAREFPPSRDSLRSVPHVAVVLVVKDVVALVILRHLDTPLLTRSHMAVGTGARLQSIDPCLAAFKLADFAVGELARSDALFDAVLLVDVALHIGLHALRGSGGRITGHPISLQRGNTPALGVLGVLDARLFPPPVYYGPPPSYYGPRVERRVVIVHDDDYRYYRHDNGQHRGWYKHKHRHDDDD